MERHGYGMNLPNMNLPKLRARRRSRQEHGSVEVQAVCTLTLTRPYRSAVNDSFRSVQASQIAFLRYFWPIGSYTRARTCLFADVSVVEEKAEKRNHPSEVGDVLGRLGKVTATTLPSSPASPSRAKLATS